MAEKEYLLGNRAKELYEYTKQITRPVPDDKVDAKDVAKVMRQIAAAEGPEQMERLLASTADRLEKRNERRRFPKSETFDLIADIRAAARAIMKGVHAANEANFNTDADTRLKHIKAVIDDCNLILKYVDIALGLAYIDTKRSAAWTKKITDVKYMCLAWLKKDTARAQELRKKEEAQETKRLVLLVREIMREEKGPQN